jgi:hypothetical protein
VRHLVDAGDLILGVDAEAHRKVDGLADDERHHEREASDREHGHALLAEERPSVGPSAVQHPRGSGDAARCSEQPDQDGADGPTNEVDTDHVERVIETEPVLESHRVGARTAGEQPQSD